MSVAFRRESDEEHKEPRFELPLPSGPNLVTARGQDLIAERIAELEAQLSSADAASAEDIRRSLRYWQTRRTTAILTPPPVDGTIGFGSVVAILLHGKPRTVAIVGDDEADPKVDALAFSAPLARALIGAEVGDVLPFAARNDAIEIVSID
ncbi:GreA/GreB family elongation factor [Sphingomonas sp.]|jgi:transcription elongation GreA/GreB family factor|uniref:GreA/GreB family elongation factor n=1 Tax=Sphingomonas sp. TaxID=28214 RepID=UPI002D7F77EF|nr:GreA/GreB family elongation factor [Sphingomonas sp.]HEU0044149.1 GreA/GreB family elongation factor [Sphingomonas sp.]